jgi:hypothetical protein
VRKGVLLSVRCHSWLEYLQQNLATALGLELTALAPALIESFSMIPAMAKAQRWPAME